MYLRISCSFATCPYFACSSLSLLDEWNPSGLYSRRGPGPPPTTPEPEDGADVRMAAAALAWPPRREYPARSAEDGVGL
jgi:hypothetical protein